MTEANKFKIWKLNQTSELYSNVIIVSISNSLNVTYARLAVLSTAQKSNELDKYTKNILNFENKNKTKTRKIY